MIQSLSLMFNMVVLGNVVDPLPTLSPDEEYATVSSRGTQFLLLSDNDSGTETSGGRKHNAETLSVSYDLIGQDLYLMSGTSADTDKEVGGAEAAAASSSSRDSMVDKYSKITSSVGVKILDDGHRGEVLHLVSSSLSVDGVADAVSVSYAQVNKVAKGRDAPSSSSSNGAAECEEGMASKEGGEEVLIADGGVGEDTEGLRDSQSMEGIYDLLGSEEPAGLARVESMKSIEMLVTDMCKSLEEEEEEGGVVKLGDGAEGDGAKAGFDVMDREREREETSCDTGGVVVGSLRGDPAEKWTRILS